MCPRGLLLPIGQAMLRGCSGYGAAGGCHSLWGELLQARGGWRGESIFSPLLFSRWPQHRWHHRGGPSCPDRPGPHHRRHLLCLQTWLLHQPQPQWGKVSLSCVNSVPWALLWPVRHHPAPLLCFSYKNPGKPDGVNYIRTDEEVRKPGDSVCSREDDIPPKTEQVPRREIWVMSSTRAPQHAPWQCARGAFGPQALRPFPSKSTSREVVSGSFSTCWPPSNLLRWPFRVTSDTSPHSWSRWWRGCVHTQTPPRGTLPGAAPRGAPDGARHAHKSFCFGQSWPLLLSYFLTSYTNKRVFLEMGKSPQGEEVAGFAKPIPWGLLASRWAAQAREAPWPVPWWGHAGMSVQGWQPGSWPEPWLQWWGFTVAPGPLHPQALPR